MVNDLQEVFQFMAIRAGEKLDKNKSRKSFIRDDDYRYSVERINYSLFDSADTQHSAFVRPNGINDVDLFSSTSISPIGKLVYSYLVDNKPKTLKEKQDERRIKLKGKVKPSAFIPIEDRVEALLISGFNYQIESNQVKIPPIIKSVQLNKNLNSEAGFYLGKASEKSIYRNGDKICILPDDLSEIYTPLANELIITLKSAKDLLKKHSQDQKVKIDINGFLSDLATKLEVQSIRSLVFNYTSTYAGYSREFAYSKRILFDSLYGLYIFKKKQPLSLEPAIDGLRACHLLEWLAILEFFYETIEKKAYPANSNKFVALLSELYPLLASWKPSSSEAFKNLEELGIRPINPIEDIQEIIEASPIINPIFARLKYTFEPFNSIKPIGIGDLKVVKQEFMGYRKTEIAHIETVLAGETKTRVHRSLEKSEDSFSFSSSNDSESTKDSQSTGRFELKNEAEETIKTDLGINANASFTYKGNPVIEASLTAGMTYANSKTVSDKSSQNYVNEVMAKATSRVQSKVSQQRQEIRQRETEETNTHTFTNIPPKDNISGIYLWLEKVYKAQIHNYGKRLMFEFILPEPAGYYVESKLYSYAASMDLPRYPSDDQTSITKDKYEPLPVKSHLEITEDMYNNDLSKKWSLADLPPPPSLIENIPIVNGKPGQKGTAFTKSRAFNDTGWLTEGYSDCSISNLFPGYYLSTFRVKGKIEFNAKKEKELKWLNSLQIYIGTNLVFDKVDEEFIIWELDDTSKLPLPDLQSTTFGIDILTKTCVAHNFNFYLTFQRSSQHFENWQKSVFDRIKNNPVKVNNNLPTSEESKKTMLNDYLKKLSEIKADAVNEIVRGKSGQWNQETIAIELKRQCISMIAKEFDSDRTDDEVSDIEATKKVELDVYFPELDVKSGSQSEDPATKKNIIKETSAGFRDSLDDPKQSFTFTDIDQARAKGRYIQFLEQAFEWNQLSYIFYPYFWASVPKWIELMNREDEADPLFTKFLQAGSSKVLLAVKPGYENAVLHFLATREPWEGGPSPVIGDPLYIPLYEEVRSQQDNLADSTPVGEPWEFTLPTSLIYLESEQHKLVHEYKE